MRNKCPLAIGLNLVAALTLASCGTPPQSAGERVVYQRVEVPVQRPCPVTKPPVPKPLARPLPSEPGRLVDLLAAKLLELMGPGGYVERADQAIATCTAPPPPQSPAPAH